MSEGDESATVKKGFAAEALEDWTPRFVSNGITHADMELLAERIDSWAEWCEEWETVGDDHYELGEEAEADGYTETAAGHFVRAAMYYHFGSHVWHEDGDYRDGVHRKAVESFGRGGQYLDPPVQRLEAPYDDFEVPGLLRVPEDGPDGEPGDSPLVIMLPGLDSIKEELHAYDEELHGRGLATLAVDGAAQGETWYNHGMSPEYYKLISAMIDHVREVDPEGVDTSRIATYGVSLGGYYSPHVAANEGRVDACVGISGPFTVGPVSARGSDLHKEQFTWGCKVDSLVETDEITEQMTLRGDIEDMACPALMITGAQDNIIAPAATERIATRAPKGEYVLYEEGNHVCNNISHKYRPLAADWLRDQLA